MRDKDHAGFLARIVPLADELVLTQARLARAATVEELAAALPAQTTPVHCRPEVADALALARRLAQKDDLICVTGSLILVGEIKTLLQGCGLSPIRG
jgi:dihydrofolate synthase/folylpolyglutamate synthase